MSRNERQPVAPSRYLEGANIWVGYNLPRGSALLSRRARLRAFLEGQIRTAPPVGLARGRRPDRAIYLLVRYNYTPMAELWPDAFGSNAKRALDPFCRAIDLGHTPAPEVPWAAIDAHIRELRDAWGRPLPVHYQWKLPPRPIDEFDR